MNKMFSDYSLHLSTPDMFTPPEDLLSNSDHIWHGSAIMWHASLASDVTTLRTGRSSSIDLNGIGDQMCPEEAVLCTALSHSICIV